MMALEEYVWPAIAGAILLSVGTAAVSGEPDNYHARSQIASCSGLSGTERSAPSPMAEDALKLKLMEKEEQRPTLTENGGDDASSRQTRRTDQRGD
jgi:hypothetical protein